MRSSISLEEAKSIHRQYSRMLWKANASPTGDGTQAMLEKWEEAKIVVHEHMVKQREKFKAITESFDTKYNTQPIGWVLCVLIRCATIQHDKQKFYFFSTREEADVAKKETGECESFVLSMEDYIDRMISDTLMSA